MVVSCRLLRLSQSWLRVHRLNGRHDLRNLDMALHLPERLLTVEPYGPQPPLEHEGAVCALDVALAVPDQRKYAFDGIR